MSYTRRQELVCTLEEFENYASVVLYKGEALYVQQANGKYGVIFGDGKTPIGELPYSINYAEYAELLEQTENAMTLAQRAKNEAELERQKAETEAQNAAASAQEAAGAARAEVANLQSQVDRNAKRLTNVESAIYGDLAREEVDDSVAHVKDVPAAAKPYARVDMIGGMTYRVNIGTEEAPEYVLRSAKVESVESVGVNKIDPVAFGTLGNWTWVPGQTEGGLWWFYKLDFAKNKNHVFTCTTNGSMFYIGWVNKGTPYSLGTRVGKTEATSAVDVQISLFFDEKYDYYLCMTSPSLYLSLTTNVQLRVDNRDGKAADFVPYVKHTLPIPAEVRAKPWYGLGISKDVCNAIRYNEDGSRSGDVQCAKVVIGGDVPEIGISNGTFIISNILPVEANHFHGTCDGYTYNSAWWTGLANNEITTYITGRKGVAIRDDSCATVDDLKAKLAANPITLVYELATPTTEDISDILPADNYIGVEGGGTLTFVNEYGYDVPSEVTFVTKEVTE